MLDYDFEFRETRLVELRSPPVDVDARKETFKDASDLCFTNGIVFVSELGSEAIRVIDLEDKECLNPEGLKWRAELLSQLGRFSLPQESVMNPEIVQLNTPLVNSTSICVATTDILLCADNELQRYFNWS